MQLLAVASGRRHITHCTLRNTHCMLRDMLRCRADVLGFWHNGSSRARHIALGAASCLLLDGWGSQIFHDTARAPEQYMHRIGALVTGRQRSLLSQVAAAVEEHPELEAALRAKLWQYLADAAANSALTRLHSSTASVLQQARTHAVSILP